MPKHIKLIQSFGRYTHKQEMTSTPTSELLFKVYILLHIITQLVKINQGHYQIYEKKSIVLLNPPQISTYQKEPFACCITKKFWLLFYLVHGFREVIQLLADICMKFVSTTIRIWANLEEPVVILISEIECV